MHVPPCAGQPDLETIPDQLSNIATLETELGASLGGPVCFPTLERLRWMVVQQRFPSCHGDADIYVPDASYVWTSKVDRLAR